MPPITARFTDAEWEILLSIGPWSCRLVAQHPIGGPRFFDRLSDDLNSYVRAGLLRNRAISEEKLLSLLQTKFPSHAQRSGYTLDTFLLNPTLSTKTVTSFLGYLSPRVRRRAMQHANVDQNIVKMLKYLCGDDKLRESHINQDSRFTDEEMLFLIELGPWPASLLAKHVHTPAHIFAVLQQKSTTDQQFSILPSMFAANPSVPEEILTELVTAQTQWLSNVIANNPAMSVQIFRKIFDVTTSATYIKRSLVLHPHITDDPTLLAAIEHPSTTLRLSFSAEQNRSYATLVNESYAYKYKYKNINDPAHHKTQLSDADFAFFAQFFGKSDELSTEIISWMLIHPALPLAQQHTAAREYPWVRRAALVQNPMIASSTLRLLVELHLKQHLIDITKHKNTDAETLDFLILDYITRPPTQSSGSSSSTTGQNPANSPCAPEFLCHIAKHAHLSASSQRLLLDLPYKSIWRRLVVNPVCTSDVLDVLAEKSMWFFYRAVEHPHASAQLLQRALQSRHPSLISLALSSRDSKTEAKTSASSALTS